ncbi:MAG: UDP-glucose/GDP-mannose dehydrogenase family protein [Candidatus Aenigmarchaeota archaeon]|nr:UDP-glucose/GDP-mannose dehydrogenase family protein [Candidatus Aenigmarchaeota archaeon]
MRISIIGTGYVGLSTGVGFAVKGNEVICVDVIPEKVNMINKGISPIYEPGMNEKLMEVLDKGLIEATSDLKKAVMATHISFISVGTPSREDGSIDLKYIKEVSKQIGEVLRNKEGYHVIVVKSTVVPGTTENVVIKNLEEHSGKKAGEDFGVCMNPEFLREGKALEDFLNPDRIVIGSIDKRSGDVLEELYKNFNAPILRTDLKTAEMIKYASNAFLATKISFANEIGNICKKLGIDVNEVMRGVGMDHRISPYFLNAGAGFGGSCFPKDVKALINKAIEVGYEPKLLEQTIKVNEKQKVKLVEQLKEKIGNLNGKTITVLGLAFKPNSDDIREAPAINIISKLLEKGAKVKAYDPKAVENMRKIFPNVLYADDMKSALKNSDACLIVTDWGEFKQLEDKDFDVMRNKVILEGRKVLDKNKVSNFDGICW